MQVLQTNKARDPLLLACEQQVHQGLSQWVQSHLNEVLGEMPYDPQNPNHHIDRVLLEANPSLERAKQYGLLGAGEVGYSQLIKDFKKYGVVDLVRANASDDNETKKPSSTLIATLHLSSALDTAITHNALFVASGDEEFANKNVVLANYIMSIMTIYGLPVDEVLTASGMEIRALTDGALKYIDPNTAQHMGRLALPVLNGVLRQGVAMHQAPSGTRAKDIILKNGTPAKSVDIIPEPVIRTIRKKTPWVVGVPMIVEPNRATGEVLEPRLMQEDCDVHKLMQDMVDAADSISEEPVFYGMPDGAQVKV